MAKKNTRSSNSPTASTPATPERRRTVRASTGASAASPEVPVAEPEGSPAVVRDSAHDRPAYEEGNGRTGNPTYEEIAEAAYQRYLARGGQDGYDFDDWIDAERALRSRQP